MDHLKELVLSAGIIALATFSMYLSHETLKSVEHMNQAIQVMFVKS